MQEKQKQAPERQYKIVVLGEAAVGKTSLLYRYVSDSFDEHPASTISASFYTKKLFKQNNKNQNEVFKLQLWDTAGQEKFAQMSAMYYRNADIVFVVFAVDSRQSFDKAICLITEVKAKQQQKQLVVLLGNKCDLPNILKEEADLFARINTVPLYWVSALSGVGIQEAMDKSVNHVSGYAQDKKINNIVAPDKMNFKSGCC
ncbi:Rab1a [Hexamita inflata]|uniref:Rab1a n=1 Tax=Hexamita inflata TaxID=28002 RepID=A0AA86TZQ2_9EUKA|nr:Rab1a [Hexamita inflata]CAI9934659.1 Rab1a [Hexamita inflata]